MGFLSTPGAGASRTELDLGALSQYLAHAIARPPAADLRAELIAGGRSNPTYRITDGERVWVLRRPPYGVYVQSGHDMKREVTAMFALQATAVPVPQVVATCEDSSVIGAPFYVMDELDGRTYRTQQDTASLTTEQRSILSRHMVQTLADLHNVDPAAVGLEDWGRPDGYLARQLDRWGRQWQAVATSERRQVAELLRRLEASLPASPHSGVVHGDFKIDNIMVDRTDPTDIIGVLDWEMSTLGDTMADLGLLISFWDEPGGLHNPITQGATALPGFPSADEVVQMYVEQRDVSVENLDWYVVFSDLKIAVILEQIHRRHLEGTTAGEGFADIGGMVEPLLDRALGRAERTSNPILQGR